MNNRTAAALQHAIQYPSGHLGRFASFGPQFEMTDRDRDSHNVNHRNGVTSNTVTTVVPATIDNEIAPNTEQFDAKRFVVAGKAIFTLQGLRGRYTYKVTQSDPDDRGRTCHFVALLTGPDNGSDYTYVGVLDPVTGSVRLTRKSRYTDQSQPVVAIRWALARVWAGREIAPARIYHAGRCGRCGRVLTVPSSVESGFGPECSARLSE